MKTKVGLSHEPKRQRPWLGYWWGEPDPDTGKQRMHTRCFRYNREARTFQAEKQAEPDRGAPRDGPLDVTLGQLLDEFLEARVSRLSHSSQTCYCNTIAQFRDQFGDTRLVRQIERRHAETFMAKLKRRDGQVAALSGNTAKQHLKHSRAIFNAAAEWGCLARNPFLPLARWGVRLCVSKPVRSHGTT